MNFSAGNARRKWPCRGRGRRRSGNGYRCRGAGWCSAGTAGRGRGGAAAKTPPRWRRQRRSPRRRRPDSRAPPGRTSRPAAPAVAAPQPSACRLALTEAIAIAPSIPDIHGAGGCGGEDLVRLEAVVLPDKQQVAVKPAAILRCAMASAIADWIRTDMAPLANEPWQRHHRSRQFRLVRMPRPQPHRRRRIVRTWPRQRA